MTEADIIRGCQSGDPRFQRALVDRYSAMLMTVSRRYASDTPMARDILQEGMIRIFRGIERYKPTGSFEAWMRRIVINTALQYLDKNWKRHEYSNLEHCVEPYQQPEVYRQLGAEELLALINTLPQGYRQIFNLYVIEGYSHKEIGKLLGISESTSRSQLTRARKLLQQQLIEGKKNAA